MISKKYTNTLLLALTIVFPSCVNKKDSSKSPRNSEDQANHRNLDQDHESSSARIKKSYLITDIHGAWHAGKCDDLDAQGQPVSSSRSFYYFDSNRSLGLGESHGGRGCNNLESVLIWSYDNDRIAADPQVENRFIASRGLTNFGSIFFLQKDIDDMLARSDRCDGLNIEVNKPVYFDPSKPECDAYLHAVPRYRRDEASEIIYSVTGEDPLTMTSERNEQGAYHRITKSEYQIPYLHLLVNP